MIDRATFRRRVHVLFAVLAAGTAAMLFVPRIPQAQSYHVFADARTLLGIPNFWNVMSNLPFLLVGVVGLQRILQRSSGALPSLRTAYAVFFIGLAAVCFGSGFYHWAPDNAALVWDRLPMSIAFMALVTVVIGEHLSERIAKAALWPLIVLGLASVLYWAYTESLGRGDLRFYGLVQFLSMLMIALTWLMFPSRFTGVKYLWGMFAGYVIAKLCEAGDAFIYDALGGSISGHALKHIAAATGMYCFVIAVERRRPVNEESMHT